MKRLLLILISIFISCHFLKAQEKTHIVSHNQTIIRTDPSTGFNSYKNWIKFPSKRKKIRNIILKVTFECPDIENCAHWDYLDHVNIRSKKDTTSYEIARMITPYGFTFGKDWKFNWTVDITDFSLLLRDDIEVTYVHSGYEDSKNRAWKITLDFEITYGKPVSEPLNIHKLYDGDYNYGDSKNPIESHLIPQNISLNKNTHFSKVKIHQTGHGMDENGCAEFCNKYRDIYINDTLVNRKNLWKPCGNNPLFPQGGSWTIDRANWCPGELIQPDEMLYYNQNIKSLKVDLNMQAYETEKPSAIQSITAYLIEYKKPDATFDVELKDILYPSTKNVHKRLYASNHFPVIKIKNNGSEHLNTLAINYGFKNKPTKTHIWKGNLKFGNETIIIIPDPISIQQDSDEFMVTLKGIPNKKDAFVFDNSLISNYKRPPVLPNTFIINYKTNNKPNDNQYKIFNAKGQLVFKKDTTNIQSNVIYKDTINLNNGLYQFKITDKKSDGLSYWYKPNNGNGIIRFEDLKGNALKHFELDFGSFLTYNFIVDSLISPQKATPLKITVFPRDSYGETTIDYFSDTKNKVTIKVYKAVYKANENRKKVLDPLFFKDEHIIQQLNFKAIKTSIIPINLSHLQGNKRYIFKVFKDDKEVKSLPFYLRK